MKPTRAKRLLKRRAGAGRYLSINIDILRRPRNRPDAYREPADDRIAHLQAIERLHAGNQGALELQGRLPNSARRGAT